MAQAADSLQAQLAALQRIDRMLGIVRSTLVPLFWISADSTTLQVDRIRAGVHQMLEDQLPGKTSAASANRVALLPYVTTITTDINTLGREGTELQAYIVAPPPPSAPQSQLALSQMVPSTARALSSLTP